MLSDYFFEDIKYFTYEPFYRNEWRMNYESTITLYFKQWWKPSKELKFSCPTNEYGWPTGGLHPDFLETLTQLKNNMYDHLALD